MDFKKIGFSLGVFSIALGAAELLASRRIARSLEAEGKEGLIRAFGGREILAGVNLLQAPAHSGNVWNRVAGDTMDLAALTAAAVHAPRNRLVWGSVAFVVAATALDVFTAIGLDKTTARFPPTLSAA